MSYFVYHRYGRCETNLPIPAFPNLLDELDDRPEDEEHGSVSLIHESQWGLGIRRNGYVDFENVEADDEPRHMENVPRAKLLELMEALARGDLVALEAEPWVAGY
ncbi:hypothetical protein OVY29_03895 [Sphingopyxis sp. SE2]|uniref:hypothetical protein n=1 Tax=unclassified Sphingopyxis TaxID=2614943 RepID=UPI00050FBA1C|nr:MULTISPECIES: hypothetical protein [unclassified Sphingopyxis]KGB53747.1 hypothetical protein FG95_03160 [Sphingopyxis sp. LC363]MDT7527804.1 hypothetical protein [Sphingopyxis sp. SE2]